jgi:hypothetical protein
VAGNRTIFAAGEVNWDEGQIRILLSGPEGETSQEIQRRARAVQKRAQYRAPTRTGQLKHSISVNTRYPSSGASADITAEAPYAAFVEFGRKAVDLRGTKKYLHWTGQGGVPVFTQYADAVEGVHFMRDALDEAKD